LERVQLSDKLHLSRLIHGHWRLAEWDYNSTELVAFLQAIIEMGVTSFDHADIYGDYTCEAIFGKALRDEPALRNQIEIITKCGIKLVSAKNTGQEIPLYDHSFNHIVKSVEQSLTNLHTDRIDLLLIHRPSPLSDPEDIAKAFSQLKKEGKVLHFGVSNYTPIQFSALQHFCDEPLVTNQIEISPYCIEHFQNDNVSFLQQRKVAPMAWSPLAGGRLFHPTDQKGVRVAAALKKVAEQQETDTIDKVAYAWLLKHPAKFLPIVGSGKIARIQAAVDSLGLPMSDEQWFQIYTAALGSNIP